MGYRQSFFEKLAFKISFLIEEDVFSHNISILEGGSIGETYLVNSSSKLVVKGRRSGSKHNLPIDSEAKLYSFLHHNGIRVPQIIGEITIDLREEQSFLVLEYIEGRNANFQDLSDILQLIDCMEELYNLNEDVLNNANISGLNEAYPSVWGYINYTFEKWRYPVLKDMVCRLNNVLKTQRSQKFLLHGDINPGNIIIDNIGNFYLIDWELSKIGEPEYDFARVNVREVWLSGICDLKCGYIPTDLIFKKWDRRSYYFYECMVCCEFLCYVIWSENKPPKFLNEKQVNMVCKRSKYMYNILKKRFDKAMRKI